MLNMKRKVSSPYAREEVLCEKLGLEKLQNELRALVQEQDADKIESEQREKELQRHNRRIEHEKEQMRVQMVALQRAVADRGDQAREAKRALGESERVLRGVQQQQEQHAEDMQVVEEREARSTVRLSNQNELLRGKMASYEMGALAAKAAARVSERESSKKDKELARKDKALEEKEETVRILGECARASAHTATALPALYRAEAKAQRYERAAETAAQRILELEEEGKQTAAKMKVDEQLLRAVMGGKRKGLTAREREVRSIAKSYWTDPLRRDNQLEAQGARHGAFGDLLDDRDRFKSLAEEFQARAGVLERRLEAAITQVADKTALVNTMEAQLQQVGAMTRQGGKYSIEYRSLLMSLVSCCPSVYQARTICRSVIKYCCGWMVEGKDFVVPQLQFLKDARRDLAPMSECLAAIRVALCDRVVQMGHDGSSIGGVDTFTVTVKIFTRSEGGGRRLDTGEEEGVYEDVSMVASGLPGGKKSEEEKEFIERVFARGREKIQLLRNQLVKEGHNPSDLGVPEAKECTIAKLAGGSLMNDTCNAARAVATKLKECLEVHAKEYFGTTDDEWEGLPKPVREARTYCVDLLCWAHLRNLFIGEGAKEEKAYLKTKLKVLYCTTALHCTVYYSTMHYSTLHYSTVLLLYCTPTLLYATLLYCIITHTCVLVGVH